MQEEPIEYPAIAISNEGNMELSKLYTIRGALKSNNSSKSNFSHTDVNEAV